MQGTDGVHSDKIPVAPWTGYPSLIDAQVIDKQNEL